ncbi:MAG: TraR/DksA family transcriptional regulator, partial [Thermoguttaceae bacterium]
KSKEIAKKAKPPEKSKEIAKKAKPPEKSKEIAKKTKPPEITIPESVFGAFHETEHEKMQLHEKGFRIEDVGGYKARLLALRDRLRGNVSTMADAALNKNRMDNEVENSTMPIHMADVGSDNFEQEQTLVFMQSEHGLLDLVNEALERIKDGTYGICEDCGSRIPKVRLNFLPYVATCVKCADKAGE